MQVLHYKPMVLNPKKAKVVFNPRFLDLSRSRGVPGNPYANVAFKEVDEALVSMKIYNFSNRVCNIGYRDGSVLTLRNTPPTMLSGIRCYTHHLKRDVDGKMIIPRNDEDPYRECPKDIKNGIYVCIMKQISTGSEDINKTPSSLGYLNHPDYENVPYIGDDYNELIQEEDETSSRGFSQQNPYTYKASKTSEIELDGFLGPTYYAGETTEPSSRNTTKEGNKRYYETAFIEYFIPIEEINRSDNRYLYVEELDITISSNLNARDMIHPYSRKGKEKRLEEITFKKTDSDGKIVSGVTIINIDNSTRSSVGTTLYINLGGVVSAVRSVTDDSMDNGIYIHRFNYADDKGNIKDKLVDYLTHNQALTHTREDIPKFYRTYNEAFTLGNIDEVRKAELKQLEHERQLELNELKDKLEKQKLVANEAKAEFEKMKLDLEKERMRYEMEVERERDQRREESDRRKDYYEERSQSRKDDSEMLKYILVATAGIAGLVIGLLK